MCGYDCGGGGGLFLIAPRASTQGKTGFMLTSVKALSRAGHLNVGGL